jgi:hypothetical protein
MDLRIFVGAWLVGTLAVAVAAAAPPQQAAPSAAAAGPTAAAVRAGRCDTGGLVLRTADDRATLVQRHEQNLRNRSVGRIGAEGGALLLSTAGASRIGARVDERDRACLGGVLQFGTVGTEVSWSNPATGVAYLATVREDRPAAVGSGTRCRVLVVLSGPIGAGRPRGQPGLRPEPLIACESDSGAWQIP